MSFQLKSEPLAYDYMLQQFKQNGNTEMVRKLETAAPTLTGPLPAAYDSLRDEAMDSLGIGTTRDMKSVIAGVFLPSWLSREYTLGEKINLWRGKFFSMKMLRDTMFATDLTKLVTELDLPVYFFHGRFDYTCSYTEAKSFFEQLVTPLKGLYTFEHSAHSPIFEEPAGVQKILLEEVMAGATDLADAE